MKLSERARLARVGADLSVAISGMAIAGDALKAAAKLSRKHRHAIDAAHALILAGQRAASKVLAKLDADRDGKQALSRP